jgi:membrane dipeptidase
MASYPPHPHIRETAWNLQKKTTVIDIHTHALLNSFYFGKNPMKRHARPLFWNPLKNQIDFPRAWDAEVNALGVVTYAIHNLFRDNDYFRPTLKQFELYEEVIQKNNDLLAHALTGDDIRKAKQEGKLALFIGVEGAHSLDGNLDHLEIFYEKGVRYLTLAHFLTNHYAQACADPNPPYRGLSSVGNDLIDELDRLDILVDVAHISEEGFWQVLKRSKKPVISSHTGLRKFCDISRNLTDDQMKAIRDSGGIIGICLWPWYLQRHGLRGPMDWVIRAILHCFEVVGPESVCIGSDMDAYLWLPREMRDISDLPVLTQYLLDYGVSEKEIMGVLGENFLKLMDRVFGTKKEKT